MKIDTFTTAQLAAYFDHSLLRPNCEKAEFDRHIEECKKYGFYSAAINSAQVPYYVKMLEGSGVKVGAAISFPFGQASKESKLEEVRLAIEQGADEIDYVINIGRLLDGDDGYVRDEMYAIAEHCRARNVLSKVIFENCYLSIEQKKAACRIAVETGIDYVKTSTGFGPGGAEPEDIILMKMETEGSGIKIKAAGAMKTLAKTAQMIELGVNRIGSAFGPSILSDFERMKAEGMTMEEYICAGRTPV